MMDDKPTANEMAKMIDNCLARAEAAENDLRELRENTLLTLGLNPVDVTDGMEDQSIAYLLGGWKERIAELEAAQRTVAAQAAYYGCPHCGKPIELPRVDNSPHFPDAW